ncbi:MAG: DegV family protein [Clostridiales bacterium]|jgi:DegV family protein with EDD domain|nr:DegV family protein [Clostridiales bacterium]
MANKPYTIITDSAANLTPGLINRYQLPIVSLSYIFEGEEHLSYRPGVESNLKSVYENMRQKAPIKTSCMNEDHCREVFEAPLKLGHDILYIGFSSGLSASYAVGETVANELKKAYPGQKIYTVDSFAAAMGQGRLVTIACEMKEKGAEIDEVLTWVTDNRLKMCHLFTVDTLFHLYRGGRVTRSKHLLADTLNIKPILHVNDEGRLVAIGKTFGRKASLANLASRMAKEIVNPEEQTIYISHGDCIEDVEYLIKRISDKLTVKEYVINILDLVVGAHSGPGTVAVFYLAHSRHGEDAAAAPAAKSLKKSEQPR